MNNVQITDEDYEQAKKFLNEDDDGIGVSKLKIDCDEYEKKYREPLETAIEIAQTLELIRFPALITKLLVVGKKDLINIVSCLDFIYGKVK